MGPRTRSQKAAAELEATDPSPAVNGTLQESPKNGAAVTADGDVEENVFLFAPNLIGKSSATLLQSDNT